MPRLWRGSAKAKVVSQWIIAPFACLSCGYEMGLVVAEGKHTALEIYMADASKAVIRRGDVVCPVCNKRRSFVEVPLSAVALGITET